MELLQLKYFCHAAQTGNFTKTAEKFGVPAPGISQSIKRLEKELTVSLFDRKSNRIILNECGRTFYERISKALQLIENAATEVSDSGISGRIKICIASNRRVVISAIRAFRKKYPQMDFIMDYSLPHEQADYDFIISDGDLQYPGFEASHLISEKILLAVSKGDVLYKAKKITAEILKDASFISMPESSSLYRCTSKICENLGFKPHIVIQCDDPFYIRKCVESGLGVTFVPEISWKGQLSENTVLKSVGSFFRDTYLYVNKNKYIPKTADDFVKLLIKEFEAEKALNL